MRFTPSSAGLGVATLLALSAAACSGGEPATSAEPPLPPGRPGLYIAAEQGAEPFVRALYAVYADGLPEAVPPGREPLYGRTLNALIGEDFRRNGDRRVLTRDPFCDCTDSAGLSLSSLDVTETGVNAGRAQAVFTLGDQTRAQTLTLAKEGPLWRVSDIAFDGQRPISDVLYEAIE